jgi:hypothetical protein
MQSTNTELRYPFVGQAAGPVKKQKFVDVRHHFLLIYSGDAIVPSPPFRGGLARLLPRTTAARK